MSRIKVPNYSPIARIGEWELWQKPRPSYGSPLWIELKLANRTLPKRWRANRAFHLCWGVDAGRLRNGNDPRLLKDQQPKVYEALLQFLSATFTPARLAARIGEPALATERARVAEAAGRRAVERAQAKADRKQGEVDPFS